MSFPTSRPHVPTTGLYTLSTSKSSIGGPRMMDSHSVGRHIGAYNTSTLRRASGYEGEPGDPIVRGPRLAINQVPTSGHTPVPHRQSTKQLIHRFESITDPVEMVQVQVQRLPGSSGISSEADLRDMHHPFLSVSHHKIKKRSLSSSLRNFMSVFKKKKDRESDDDDHILPQYAPELNIAFSREPTPLPIAQMVPHPSAREIVPPSNKSESLLSGTLLYLSRPPSHLPVWISCTVELYHLRLLLTWYTMHDTPSSHIIQLDGFMDVHSLNERTPRPEAEGDLKTFELTFEGRPRETFAATSSQDRAQWVGAIWDVVLSPRGKGETPSASKHNKTLSIRTDVTLEHKGTGQSSQPPSPPEEAGSEYTSSSAPKSSSVSALQPTPPPTPIAKSPRQTLSPLSISPPRPPSQLSNPHSRSKSPSIANLGSLSVVTQRLAQIERSELASSASSAVSSSSVGTALRRAQITQPTHRGRPFADIEKLHEENAGGSKVVQTPLTDASIVIPLPNPPLSDTVSARSAFRRNRAEHQPSPALTPPRSPAKASASFVIPTSTMRAKLSEPAIREHIENPPMSPLAVGMDPQLAPLAELIKDTAAKHYDQTAGLGEQIIALQQDIQILPNEIQVLLGQAVATSVQRASNSNSLADNTGLQNILTSLEALRKQTLGDSEHPQMDSLIKMIGDLQTRLVTLAPIFVEKLASIEEGQMQLQLQATQAAEQRLITTRDVPRSPHPSSPTEIEGREGLQPTDLSDIRLKLDELTSLYRSSVTSVSAGNIPLSQTAEPESEKLKAIIDHLKLDEEQRKLQFDQQADSVRYLNELNSWLESFVNGGTAHIQSVAANVEQLCAHLGVSSENDTADGQPSSQGMLDEIKHLISSVQSRALGESQLQASVGELMDAVKDQMKNGAEQRTALVTDSVLEIIHRQRHEQEQMLRALSTELTNEIRGERLRFVEAMKEATAINVQAHVEHFKSELSREVAAMTQDVGRLHQEKQAIEQQIADLFAFYSKQKQEAESNPRRNAPPRSTGFSNLQNLPASTSRRPRRPLPHPVFQRKD